MKHLDLHGIPHRQIEMLVENFVLLEDLPVRIITGNSSVMQAMVFKILRTHNLFWYPENDWNLGAFIVCDYQ